MENAVAQVQREKWEALSPFGKELVAFYGRRHRPTKINESTDVGIQCVTRTEICHTYRPLEDRNN